MFPFKKKKRTNFKKKRAKEKREEGELDSKNKPLLWLGA